MRILNRNTVPETCKKARVFQKVNPCPSRLYKFIVMIYTYNFPISRTFSYKPVFDLIITSLFDIIFDASQKNVSIFSDQCSRMRTCPDFLTKPRPIHFTKLSTNFRRTSCKNSYAFVSRYMSKRR